MYVVQIDNSGRRALVTGAASGIGRAVCLALADSGAHVLAVDLDRAGLDTLVAEHSGIEPFRCDLSDGEAVQRLPHDVDILVNNAGIQHVSALQDFPVETFELITRLMLTAPFLLIRQSLPHMYERGWGRVINISSAHGLRASEYKSAYVSAKHGLEGLSKVTALEGAAHGVTSVTVNPSYVRTPLVEKQIADQARTHGISPDEVIDRIMLDPVAVKRLVEPDEVAELVAFLTGPASASMTGASYPIDGGWSAG